jgi:hypothetical protein
MMQWSDFFGFLMFIIELFKLFVKVLRLAVSSAKRKSNRLPRQR